MAADPAPFAVGSFVKFVSGEGPRCLVQACTPGTPGNNNQWTVQVLFWSPGLGTFASDTRQARWFVAD